MTGKLNGVTVIKIGGSTLGSHDTTIEDLVTLQRQGKRIVVVHGGGKLITEWLQKQGITTRAVGGERVTDRATLDVVTAVLAGLVNKQIVADITRRGGRAAGISGADGGLVQGRIKDPDMGYVGEVSKVDLALVDTLLGSGYIPVVATVSITANAGEAATLLNVNADIVAGEIAAAAGADRLVFLTDVAGVQDRQGAVISHLSEEEARSLIAGGTASGGMIPKITACLRALCACGSARIIDGRKPHALLREMQGENGGTTIGKVKAER